jgi:hypothetical protein
MENPALHYNAEFQLTWESCGFATPPSISPAPTATPTLNPLCTQQFDGLTIDLTSVAVTMFQDVAADTYTIHPCAAVTAPSMQCDGADDCVGFQVDGTERCWCLGKPDPSATIWELISRSSDSMTVQVGVNEHTLVAFLRCVVCFFFLLLCGIVAVPDL